MTGTTLFPNESDEEIVDRVTTGFRPEWPSNNLTRRLTGALWEQIKACWNQEPKERPTAPNVLETLLALGKTYRHEPVASVDDPDGRAIIREWKFVEDFTVDSTFIWLGVTPGLTSFWFTAISAHEGYKAHRNSNNPHGSTLVSSFLSGFKSPHHTRSPHYSSASPRYSSASPHHASKSGGRRRRFSERVRRFLHLPRHATTKPVKKPALGTEITDQRKENVTVRDDRARKTGFLSKWRSWLRHKNWLQGRKRE